MVKVTIENGFCISVKILVPSHQGVKRLNFVKKIEKYQFSAILGFWNISNTQKPPFGIKLNALPIKRSDLRHPRTTYVVTPGGQTCTFWRKMTRFWQFYRVFQLLYTFTHEIPPKTYVFSENMVKNAIENVFCISIIIPVLSHQGVERLNFVKKTKKYEFLSILSFWNISNTQKNTIWNTEECITY